MRSILTMLGASTSGNNDDGDCVTDDGRDGGGHTDGSSGDDDDDDVGDGDAGKGGGPMKPGAAHTRKHNMILCEGTTLTTLQRREQSTHIHGQLMMVIMVMTMMVKVVMVMAGIVVMLAVLMA